MSRNAWFFWGILAILIVSLLIVFPIDRGIISHSSLRLGLDLKGGTRLVYKADLSQVAKSDYTDVMNGAVAVLSNRINPLGVSESSVHRLGEDQILVEIPGKALTDVEKNNLARVALLEFGEQASDNETAKWPTSENQTGWKDSWGRWKAATGAVDNQTLELSSKYFEENTYVTTNSIGQVLLIFQWDDTGSKLSEQITTRLVTGNQPLGIFEGDQPLIGEDGRPIAPLVQGIISTKGQIEGLSAKEASRLSAQLNAGRLPVPLSRTGDEKNVEPILGESFVSKSVKAGILGIAMTMLFMILYYRISGGVATIALAYYALLTLAIFKLLGVTLTLSGIGGFVLSIGMAIDANVLIFERMKEELWTGRTLGAAIDAGFSRAWSAIWDSNLTTILAGAILYWLGSVSFIASDMAKGFAVTLMIGVAVSLFTAVTVTRTLIRPLGTTSLAKQTSLFAPYQRKKDA
jgi:preprotein translocase subunit SecD